ncbi:unnamed protein product [Schistosoma mattheei]|uniref:Uncharacterized protein n=1 Tax=Schistosoma mattheei TaxID=31246 RepID=A0A183NFC5_9TREM|nr:unnamed protein product [Schistosoma mattheei]
MITLFTALLTNSDFFSTASQFTALPKDLANVRQLISKLANAIHVDEFYAQKQQQLEKCIEDVNLQLEPFEKVYQLIWIK